MWWVTNNAHGAYMARGIHGSIYVDPKAEMVIVRYAAHPVAASAGNDPLTLPAFQAVAEALMRPGFLKAQPAARSRAITRSPSMIRLSTSSKSPFMTGAIFQPAPPVM